MRVNAIVMYMSYIQTAYRHDNRRKYGLLEDFALSNIKQT